MKVLFIGGTGLISSACAALAVECHHELFILNRGQSQKYPLPPGAQWLAADIHGDPSILTAALRPHHFDVVVDWIAFAPDDIERDLRLFSGRVGQYVFISSASVYQKPPQHYLITEETPLDNPFWDYARNKIACENRLRQAWRESRFPVTIIRPSLTYGPSQLPFSVGSWEHPYTVIDRMRRGQKIIVPGDGASLWVLTWNGDFAKGLVGLLGCEGALGEAFHITSDEVLTWDAIYREAGRALGVDPCLVHVPSDLLAAYAPHALGSLIGDKANSAVFDNTKIKRFVPGFAATVSWAAGVRRALAWHAADPARCTVDADANHLWDTVLAAYARAWPDGILPG